jgi:hypothetical protein
MTKKTSNAQRKRHQKVNRQKRKPGSSHKQLGQTGQRQELLQQTLHQVVITEEKSYGDEPGQDVDREMIIEHALLCATAHELGRDPGTYTIVHNDPVPFFLEKPTTAPWSHTLYYTDSVGDEDECAVWCVGTTPPAGTPYTHCFWFNFDMEVTCTVYRTPVGTYAAQSFILESAEPDLEITRKVVDATLKAYDSDRDDHLFKAITVQPFMDATFGRSWHVALDQEAVDVIAEMDDDNTLIYVPLVPWIVEE